MGKRRFWRCPWQIPHGHFMFLLSSCFFAGDKGHEMAMSMQCDLNFRRRDGRQHWQLLLVTGTASDNDTKLHFHPVRQATKGCNNNANMDKLCNCCRKDSSNRCSGTQNANGLPTGNRLERERERERERDPSAKLKERPSGEQVTAKSGTKCWGLIQRQTAAKLKEAAAAPVARCQFNVKRRSVRRHAVSRRQSQETVRLVAHFCHFMEQRDLATTKDVACRMPPVAIVACLRFYGLAKECQVVARLCLCARRIV